MDYNIENKIQLSEEAEYKSLYKWSLQEFNSDGKQIGRDQIPCPWSLYFTASSLSHYSSIDINEHVDENDEGAAENESISAILHSGTCRDGKNLEDDVYYSMFGTKRTIKTFDLVIHKLKDENDKETCRMWGAVSYTCDVDFRDETTDDVVQIWTSLSPKRFDNLVEQIKSKCVDILRVRLSGVSGFYSDWSPSITAHSIKILTGSPKEQKVIIQEGGEINPPRLGHVNEFDLSIVSTNNLNPKLNLNGVDMDKLFEESYGDNEDQESAPDKESLMLATLQQNEALLKKLLTPLWLILAALFFIYLKQ